MRYRQAGVAAGLPPFRAGVVNRAVAELDDYFSNPGVWSIEGIVRSGFSTEFAATRWVALVRKRQRAAAALASTAGPSGER